MFFIKVANQMKEFRNSYKVTLMGKKSHDEFHFIQQHFSWTYHARNAKNFIFSLDKMR